MRIPTQPTVCNLVLYALALFASASIGTPLVAGESGSASSPAATLENPPPSRAAVAIDNALARGWSDLRLLTECQKETGLLSTDIFGTGIGIWNGKKQFTLSPEQIRTLLKSLRDAEFAAMPDAFRRDGKPAPPGFICRVALQIDAVAKQVAQPIGSKAPESFQRLVDQILAITDEAGSSGISATDLNDALAKVGSGQLAAETLSLRSHRKTSRDQHDAEGWISSLHGLTAVSRSVSVQKGYGQPQRLELERDALMAIARQLAAQRPANLPSSLPGEHDTTFRIEVLNHHLEVQARRAGDEKLTEPSEHQQRLQSIEGELLRLHRLVLSAGQAVKDLPTR